MLTTITIIVSGTIMASRRELFDPFSDVRNLFTGDARRVALAHGFTCQDAWSGSPVPRFSQCVQHATDPIYSDIYLWTLDSTGEEVGFSLRDHTLTLGDLVLLWGKPETYPYCEALVVSWSIHQIKAMAVVDRTPTLNYVAPIAFISFSREGWPDGERESMNDALHGCDPH